MSSAVNNLGTFDPNQYKNNGAGGRPVQRMAGDMLRDFAIPTVKKEEEDSGKEYDRDYRYGSRNGNDNNINITNVAPASASNAGSSSSSNATAVLPKDMQQDMIDRGGTINADGSYEVGSAFESRWEKRHSPENLAAQKKAQEDLFAHAGVSSREEYFASDRHKASRSRAQSDTQRLKEKQAKLGYR